MSYVFLAASTYYHGTSQRMVCAAFVYSVPNCLQSLVVTERLYFVYHLSASVGTVFVLQVRVLTLHYGY